MSFQATVGVSLRGNGVARGCLVGPLLARMAALGRGLRAAVVGLIDQIGAAVVRGDAPLDLDVARQQGHLGSHAGRFLLGEDGGNGLVQLEGAGPVAVVLDLGDPRLLRVLPSERGRGDVDVGVRAPVGGFGAGDFEAFRGLCVC